ncbi:MAG TPA: TolC family protein, partial [Fodinibius sp.]|nr:TolC family protein [Fodinibius sp.]
MNRKISAALPFADKVAALIMIGVMIIAAPAVAQKADSTVIAEIGGQQQVLTLTEAIDVALANNSDIKRSLLSLRNADEQVRLAWSEVLPDISTSATYTRNLEIPVNFVPAQFFDPEAPAGDLVPLQFGTDNNWQGGLSVEQTLFRGEAFVGIGSSKVYKAVQAENLRATAQQIVTQTRVAYYNVLVAREQLRLQTATVERL